MPTKLPLPPIAKPKVSHREIDIEDVLIEMWCWQRAQVADLLRVLRKLKGPK